MKSTLPPELRDPVRVAQGKAGMLSRWGPPRVVRLDDLTAPQRRVVIALIDAAKVLATAGQS